MYKMTHTLDPLTETIVGFIESIGIKVSFKTISQDTFLPGILINEGSLIVDRHKLLYPGDLLHEAGHIAVSKPEDRMKMLGDIGANTDKNIADGEEMMAIAWSYAASVHLRLAPEIVFHPAGYKGSSDWYIEQYTGHKMLYVPLLQWAGFCYDTRQAQQCNVPPFPHMTRWLRA